MIRSDWLVTMKEEGKLVYRRHPSNIVHARISSTPTTLRIHWIRPPIFQQHTLCVCVCWNRPKQTLARTWTVVKLWCQVSRTKCRVECDSITSRSYTHTHTNKTTRISKEKRRRKTFCLGGGKGDMLLARIISVEADQERNVSSPLLLLPPFLLFDINDVARPRSGLAQQHSSSRMYLFLAGPFVCPNC